MFDTATEPERRVKRQKPAEWRPIEALQATEPARQLGHSQPCYVDAARIAP
jgi:hypothetical protein